MGKLIAGGMAMVGFLVALVGIWQLVNGKSIIQDSPTIAAGLAIMFIVGVLWVFNKWINEEKPGCCECCTCKKCTPAEQKTTDEPERCA